MGRTKFRLSDSSDCRGLKQFPATNMHKQTIVLMNCVHIVTSPHNQDAAQRIASPFATKHKVHLKSKAILKSVILLSSDIEYPRGKSLSKRIWEAQLLFHGFLTKPCIGKLKTNHDRLYPCILFQKNISSHLPPRPSPWFPVVSNEQNIYCILLEFFQSSEIMALKSTKYLPTHLF